MPFYGFPMFLIATKRWKPVGGQNSLGALGSLWRTVFLEGVFLEL